MLNNGIVKTLALLAALGVAACGNRDAAEIPADEVPAAEAPAEAPEAQPLEVTEDTAIVEAEDATEEEAVQ
jgi:hypothetical protein